MTPEELVQVAVLEVFHGDEVGLAVAAAHAEHAGDVGVLEDGEEAHLPDELGPVGRRKRLATERPHVEAES